MIINHGYIRAPNRGYGILSANQYLAFSTSFGLVTSGKKLNVKLPYGLLARQDPAI